MLPGAAYERDPTIDYEVHKALLHTMATCHSLRVVDSELVGDPLDLKMFQFTDWLFEENARKPSATDVEELNDTTYSMARPPAGLDYGFNEPTRAAPVRFQMICESIELIHMQRSQTELRILKCFEFIPQLRRASVIVRQSGKNDASIYVKGAPECMKEICKSTSCMLVEPKARCGRS